MTKGVAVNVKGYAKVRAALDDAGIIGGISPVPCGDEDVRFVTVRFPDSLFGALYIQDVLDEAGLLCGNGARQLNSNPALRVISSGLGDIEFEDMHYMPSLGEYTD